MSFHSPVQKQERTDAEPLDSHDISQSKCDSGQLSDSASNGTFAASRFGHDFSGVRVHADEAVQTLPSHRTQPMVQRFPKNEEEVSAPCPTCPGAESAQTPAAAESETESAAPSETPVSALIMDDSAAEVGPGQMRKSEFLARLRAEVCRTIETAIAGSGRSTDGCPYIGHWFDFYGRQDSAHLERAIHRYAPETSNSTTAMGYISAITQRARQAAETWARTGEITGVPEGVPTNLPGEPVAQGGEGGGGAAGLIMFKTRKGGVKGANDPQAIQKELGEGRSLEGSVRSRMESAFGVDFAHVRTHTDTTAAGLSDRMNARAFTIGEHVAFGANEYKPGTLMGDALIAHELAHTVQQKDSHASAAPMQGGDTTYNSLENDADKSAEGALVSIWSDVKSRTSQIAEGAVPRLRSGLRLQRCTRPRYITNIGTNVTVLESGRPPSVPDLTVAQANAILNGWGLLSKVVQIGSPTNRYDCHGYTFLGGDGWINDDQVDTILTQNGYSVTSTPRVGDIVVYRLGGSITHTGIIAAVSGTTVTQVRSKWGRLGLYRHAPNDVPPSYGAPTPYHTSRSGGHRLRRRP
jgi:hypothetical protein